MVPGNKQTNRSATLNNFSSSIVKVSLKINSMSLGLVVLEKKLLMRTPHNDDIMSADIKSTFQL